MPRFSRWIKSTVTRRTTVEDTDLFALVTDDPNGAAVTFSDLQTQLGGGGGGAVASVNGQTGVVALDADDIPDGTTAKQFTATEETKLAGIATGATANSTDAFLLARANHTGTQAQSTVTSLVSDLALKAPLASPAFTGTPTGITKTHVGLGNVDNTSDANKPVSTAQATAIGLKLDTTAAPELIRDTMGTALVAGANVTITPNDALDTITIAASGGGGGGTVTSVNGDAGPAVNLIASEIPFTPAGTIGSTNVQAAIAEVDVDVSAAALDAQNANITITNHMGDATNAHAASAIGFTPTGNIAATTVQAAIAEVATEANTTRVMQAAGGTWPARPTADANVLVIWQGYIGRSEVPPGALDYDVYWHVD